MRAEIQVASNGRLTLQAERSNDIRQFELGDWVEVYPADPPADEMAAEAFVGEDGPLEYESSELDEAA